MNVQIFSDLHLEMEIGQVADVGDVIVAAGDVHVGIDGVYWLVENFGKKPVVYVLGNHEFYGDDFYTVLEGCKKAAEGTNVHVLENEEIEIDGVRFIGSTLWTDFRLFGEVYHWVCKSACGRALNDFNEIQIGGKAFTPDDAERLFGESMKFIRSLEYRERTVVVTHNCPSFKSVPGRFQEDRVSAGFASNLDRTVAWLAADLWVHGHTHDAFDYMIGDTRVVCNPHGYVFEKNCAFVPDLVVEV